MRLFDIADRANPAPSPAVSVNGVEVSRADIAREIQNHPAPTPGEAHEAAVRALVVRELLLQEAARLGIAATPQAVGEGARENDEDATVRALLEDQVAVPDPGEAECRRFYEQNLARFRGPDIFEVSHILFSADRADADAFANAVEAAGMTIKELEEHPERFGEIAAAHSDCPSAGQGGNLGQITSGQTTPEFEAALLALQPGQISPEPVWTPYGAHVIHLARRIDGEQLPFEAVGEKITDYLADAVFHRAVHQYVGILAGRGRIEGFEMAGASSPLVQ
jgi:peptidyl-prolyl cis-trans isomerase C